MANTKEKTFSFVVVGGGIAGVTCVEQVNMTSEVLDLNYTQTVCVIQRNFIQGYSCNMR